jgi:hypothetical protein
MVLEDLLYLTMITTTILILIFKYVDMKKFINYYGEFALMCATVAAMAALVIYMAATHGYHNPLAS